MDVPRFSIKNLIENEEKEKSHFFFCVPGQAMDGLLWVMFWV